MWYENPVTFNEPLKKEEEEEEKKKKKKKKKKYYALNIPNSTFITG